MDCNTPGSWLSMEFSRQEYQSGLPWPPPEGLPDPRIEPISLMSPALAGEFFTATWKSWVRKIPWRREWQPTPVFLPGKSQGLRSLAGYSSWGRKELDATEQLILLLSLSFHYLSLMDWLYWEVRHEKPWNFNSLIIYQHPSDEFPKPKSPECFILFWWWLCGHQKKHQNNGSDDPRRTQTDSNDFKIRYIEVHKLLIVLQIILN